MAAISVMLMLCGDRLALSEREAHNLHRWLFATLELRLPQNNWLFSGC